LKARYAEGRRTALLFGTILSLLLTPVIYLTFAKSRDVLLLLAPGINQNALQDGSTQLRAFTLALLPMLWSGVLAAYLQARQVFWVTALGQCFNNTMVIVLLLLTNRVSTSLGAGNMLGFGGMLLLHWLYLARWRKTDAVASSWREPLIQTRKALWLAVPPLLALLPPLIASVVVVRALSRGPHGTLAECGFAGRPLLAVALLPMVMNTILLPRLSEARNANTEAFLYLIRRALRLTLLLTLPLMGVLLVLRYPFVQALFGSRVLGQSALRNIALYFGILLLSAPGASLSGMLSQISASLQDTRAASLGTLLTAVLTMVLVPFAARWGGPSGVIAVLALMSWVMCGWLTIYLKIVHGLRPWSRLGGEVMTVVVVALAAGLSAYATHSYLLDRVGMSQVAALVDVVASGGVGAVVAYAAGLCLGLEEMREASLFLRWQAGRLLSIPQRG